MGDQCDSSRGAAAKSPDCEDVGGEGRPPELDKAFPVVVSGPGGITFGVARNISDGGVFVEAREAQPLGCRVTVTFVAVGSAAEVAAEAEVQYVSTMNYRGGRNGLVKITRGMGLRFVRFIDEGRVAADVVDDDAGTAGNLH